MSISDCNKNSNKKIINHRRMVLKEIKNNRTRENKTAVKLRKTWYKEENKMLQVNEGRHRK